MQERSRYHNSDVRPASMPVSPPPVGKVVAPTQSFLRRWRWQALLVGVVVLGIGFLAYGYITTRDQLSQLQAKTDQSEVKRLVDQIGKTLVLPSETPTLATVNDVTKLKNQEFFQNAQNGDKVLIFSNSGRALLYRPSTKKIIEYAKVDLNNNSASGSGTN